MRTLEEITKTGINFGEKQLNLDYKKIVVTGVDGIDHRDAPDYCDAYITSAEYEGRELTDEEIDLLNEDSDFVYESVIDWIY